MLQREITPSTIRIDEYSMHFFHLHFSYNFWERDRAKFNHSCSPNYLERWLKAFDVLHCDILYILLLSCFGYWTFGNIS
ncbi:hypothetical protein Syun_014238 [Stephania yunnanensis]|uniref:Uncharacterized protein n=1 Tax=Stephania yunnanensis TaxID=152371 RepID=A0AAP0JIX9_9MAGN